MGLNPSDQTVPNPSIHQSDTFAPVYVALGSNQALAGTNSRDLLQLALELSQAGGARVLRVSRLWRSPAWPPGSDSPDYLNQVVALDWSRDGSARSADQLLSLLQTVESRLGRVRDPANRNAPRTLDLDIISAGSAVIAAPPRLIVPHPRALERDFVLAPLLEIAPGWSCPATGASGAQALAQVRAGLAPGSHARPLPAS
jgi:2-amino-4-hydroxy-6-hydroxymethyldihydropteridine diphosphokinase